MSTLISATLATLAATAQTASDEGLSFTEVLSNLPTDPASIFAILLVVVSFALVLWFGRPKGGKGGKAA
jgi:hypothetical protein